MTTPAAAPQPTYRDRWSILLTKPHTPREWDHIADAIAFADQAPVNRTGEPMTRGGEDWCRLAITALERPPRPAAEALPVLLPNRCLADRRLLEAWLNAPLAYADEGQRIVADRLDLVDWTDSNATQVHQGITRVLDAAQRAGLFGVHGYTIEVHAHTDEDLDPVGYLVVLRPALGPGLASRPLDEHSITPRWEPYPISGTVTSLINIATAANAVLDQRDNATTSRRVEQAEQSVTPYSFPTLIDSPAVPTPSELHLAVGDPHEPQGRTR
jgi:hypothetical protein